MTKLNSSINMRVAQALTDIALKFILLPDPIIDHICCKENTMNKTILSLALSSIAFTSCLSTAFAKPYVTQAPPQAITMTSDSLSPDHLSVTLNYACDGQHGFEMLDSSKWGKAETQNSLDLMIGKLNYPRGSKACPNKTIREISFADHIVHGHSTTNRLAKFPSCVNFINSPGFTLQHPISVQISEQSGCKML